MQLIQEVHMIARAGALVYRHGTAGTGVADALQATLAAQLEPQYAPELANFRANAPRDQELWGNWIFTPSIRATGRTSQGSNVVVYAHVPNYFCNPDNIRKAVREGLRAGAGALPQEEFQRLVDLDGQTDENDIRRVWVIDYDTLKRSSSGVMSLEQALEHPQTIPFIGSEHRAQAYLAAHQQVYDTRKIGVWHTDDFDERTPMARLLFFGNVGGGLSGYDLYGSACVLGIAPGVQHARGTGIERAVYQRPTLPRTCSARGTTNQSSRNNSVRAGAAVDGTGTAYDPSSMETS